MPTSGDYSINGCSTAGGNTQTIVKTGSPGEGDSANRDYQDNFTQVIESVVQNKFPTLNYTISDPLISGGTPLVPAVDGNMTFTYTYNFSKANVPTIRPDHVVTFAITSIGNFTISTDANWSASLADAVPSTLTAPYILDLPTLITTSPVTYGNYIISLTGTVLSIDIYNGLDALAFPASMVTHLVFDYQTLLTSVVPDDPTLETIFTAASAFGMYDGTTFLGFDDIVSYTNLVNNYTFEIQSLVDNQTTFGPYITTIAFDINIDDAGTPAVLGNEIFLLYDPLATQVPAPSADLLRDFLLNTDAVTEGTTTAETNTELIAYIQKISTDVFRIGNKAANIIQDGGPTTECGTEATGRFNGCVENCDYSLETSVV